MIARVDLSQLYSLLHQMQAHGVEYGLGAKAEGGQNPNTKQHYNPRSNRTLDTPIGTIDNIDCSGFLRYALYHSTGGQLRLPDGSQNQRAWCEKAAAAGELHKVGDHAAYPNVQRYLTNSRLFLCFIKPGAWGCGTVGHVWLVGNTDSDSTAETLESYGGHGVGSRNWNTPVLLRQVYSAYELPTTP